MKPDTALIKIGSQLRKIRKQKGHGSYEYFAYENDLNKITIMNIERGKNFEMFSLLKILDILGVTPEEFFKGIK
jgi:transcriptional regulator with XRE-family HTH domain